MPRRKPAGRRLRERWDAELAAEAQRRGVTMEWDARELEHLALAADTADRREHLLTLLAAEKTGDDRPEVIVKLSTEIRGLDRQLVDLLGRLSLSEAPAKSERHQKAVATRWARVNGA